jgi:uncharacterized protein
MQRYDAACAGGPAPPRLLIVPGLHGSGDEHWQTWLERRHRASVRVVQHDWSAGDLDRWAQRIATTRAQHPRVTWIAVAHSFGSLALVRHLQQAGSQGIVAALLVAPADPQRFGAEQRLRAPLPLRDALVVASRNDPWLTMTAARSWAQVWGVPVLDAGAVGHINVASGHGPWPLGQRLVQRRLQAWQAAHGAPTEERAAA